MGSKASFRPQMEISDATLEADELHLHPAEKEAYWPAGSPAYIPPNQGQFTEHTASARIHWFTWDAIHVWAKHASEYNSGCGYRYINRLQEKNWHSQISVAWVDVGNYENDRI